MHLQESILCATAPSSSSSTGPGAISLHDIQTGSTLASFKQTNAAPHCTAFVESRNAQGGFMLASQPDKSILNLYTFQKVIYTTRSSTLTLLIIDLGSNQPENGVARKTHMYCDGSTRRLLCRRNCTRADISMGGE